jgi:hypothetical protein
MNGRVVGRVVGLTVPGPLLPGDAPSAGRVVAADRVLVPTAADEDIR